MRDLNKFFFKKNTSKVEILQKKKKKQDLEIFLIFLTIEMSAQSETVELN